MFDRSHEIPIDTGAFLQVRYDETRRALYGEEASTCSMTSRSQEVMVDWKFPPMGWYVLNSDGAAKGSPGLAGGGGGDS